VLIDKESMFNGNTVLAPEYLPSKKNEEYEKLRKARQESLKRNQQLRINKKLKVLLCISAVFILGIAMIYRYSVIYDMEKQVGKERSIESKLQIDNDNIKIQLAKYNDINKIEEFAINKLHMVQPDKGAAIYMDLNKSNFKDSSKKVIKNEGNDILNKIKSFLF
jgi:cell division protein FtsL